MKKSIYISLFVISIFQAVLVLGQTHTEFKAKNFPPEKRTEFTKALSSYKEGEKVYKAIKDQSSVDVDLAIRLFKTAFDFNPNHIALNRYLVDLYQIKGKKNESFPHLEKLYDLKETLNADELFLLASLLQTRGSFTRAEIIFKQFQDKHGNNLFWTDGRLQNPKKRIEECKTGQSLVDAPQRFKTRKPFLNHVPNAKTEHLFYNYFYGWWGYSSQGIEKISTINKRNPESINTNPSNYLYADINARVLLLCDDSVFTDASPVALLEIEKLNGPFKNRDPYISLDLKTVYFSSDRPGGLGGYDIWVARFDEKGKLQSTSNAGAHINDEFDQLSPVFSADGARFFMASNGKGTTGGFDILYTDSASLGAQKEGFKNMGLRINSGLDETAIIFDITGTKGFVKRIQSDSIYFMPFKETGSVTEALFIGSGFETASAGTLPTSAFEWRINESMISGICKLQLQFPGKEYGSAHIEIFDLQNGQTVYKNSVADTCLNLTVLLPSLKNYGVHVNFDNGLPFTAHLNLKTDEIFMERTVPVEFKTIKKGNAIVLNNIVYNRDYTEMDPGSAFEIRRMAEFLRKNPKLKVEVAVHTDSLSMHGVAIAAGESAAFEINELFKGYGIEKKRLDWMFYGAEKPVSNGKSSTEVAQNRRIELVITDK